jgi:hypothetical protein
MILDRQKLHALIHRPIGRPGTRELRRDGSVFFIGGELDPQETLETVFDSHCQAPAELMLVTFGGVDTFHRGEEIVRLLKKNFHVHVMARFAFAPPPYILERTYAAGADLVDIPLTVFDAGLSAERGLGKEECLASLETARGIFPAWGVASSLAVGEEACCSTVSGIDVLLKAGIVPLPELSPRGERYPREEIEKVFLHLAAGLEKRKVAMKPLLPLLSVTTPLSPARPGGMLQGFIDRLQDRRLLAASDLRRSLRVKQVEESFESAGL